MPLLMPSYARCQGRTVRAAGQTTLAVECIRCARRTDLQPGVAYSWMQPSRDRWCAGRISIRVLSADEVVED